MAKRGRPKKQVEKEVVSTVPARDLPPEELQTTVAEVSDRMLRYSDRPKTKPPCPECGYFPVVTVQKRGPYASYRCRECGFRWEVVE